MKDTYTINIYDGDTCKNSVELKRSLFTCSMIAMDASDRVMCITDIVDNNTGEVLAIWDHGIMVYDATAGS